MDSTALPALALSEADRAVLEGRRRFLGRFMKYSYVLLVLALGGFVLKDVLVYQEFAFRNVRDPLYGIVLVGASLAVTHLALALYERKIGRALRADLAGGVKIRKSGVLVSVCESAENEPTRIQFCEHLTASEETFELRSIRDLIRIKPGPLVGRSVEIEYAPTSRMVLRLRAVS